MDISIDFASFTAVHRDLEAAVSSYGATDPESCEVLSDSTAMDAFAARLEEFRELKRRLDDLLLEDSWALFQVSTRFGDTDSAIAASYARAMHDSRETCIEESSPYYDAVRRETAEGASCPAAAPTPAGAAGSVVAPLFE